MSALPAKADIGCALGDVRFVTTADITARTLGQSLISRVRTNVRRRISKMTAVDHPTSNMPSIAVRGRVPRLPVTILIRADELSIGQYSGFLHLQYALLGAFSNSLRVARRTNCQSILPETTPIGQRRNWPIACRSRMRIGYRW